MGSDIGKFRQFIKSLEGKRVKVAEVMEKTRGDIVERGKEIEQMEKEKIRFQRIVEKQEISASDVEKMNIQKEKLERWFGFSFPLFFFFCAR